MESVIYKRTGRADAKFAANVESGQVELGGFSKAAEDENLITKLSLADSVDFGPAVEVSDVKMDLSLLCQAGHTTKAKSETLSIDTMAPRLKITWDNNDVRNEKYYKANRTATIEVEERNFDESKCEFITTGPSPSISGWSHNGDRHIATVTFSADGDYTFTFRTTDRAGHTTDYGQTDTFVVDKTVPVINVSYNNNNAENGFYYKEARLTTITVNEHNFRASEVKTTMTANDDGAGIAAPGVNGWSTSGDVNTATVNYGYDGEFTFAMTYEDLAGNQAVAYPEDHFVVDLQDPFIEIYDIVDKSANNDVVAPGIRYSDTNYDVNGVEVSLMGANNGEYSLDGNKATDSNGVDLKLDDFPREKEVDDLYTMTAKVTDLSGRTSEQQVMFSVNRFGSVYVLDDMTKKLVKENDGYTNKEQMVGVREINVDTLEKKDVSYSRDGELEKLTEDEDYTVKASGSQETWKEYYYQIKEANFKEEGNYNVTLFSEDAASNTQDNKSNKRNEECNVEFVIDKTMPSTVVSGIENAGRYTTTERKVMIDAKDNTRLEKVIAEIDDKRIEFAEKDINNGNGTVELNLSSANRWQNVKIYAVDKAGNTDEKEMKPMRVIITSNVLVQYINNIPLLVGSIIAVILSAAGAWWILFGSKKRKEQE